jgi:hypothetical protein
MSGPGETPRRGGVPSRFGSVEVTRIDDGSVALRDLKNQAAPAVVFNAQEWADFVRGVKANQFGPAQGPGQGPGGRPGLDVESTVRLKV